MKRNGRKFEAKRAQGYTLSLLYIYGSLVRKLNGWEEGVKVSSEENGRFPNRSMCPPSVSDQEFGHILDDPTSSNLQSLGQEAPNTINIEPPFRSKVKKFLPLKELQRAELLIIARISLLQSRTNFRRVTKHGTIGIAD